MTSGGTTIKEAISLLTGNSLHFNNINTQN